MTVAPAAPAYDAVLLVSFGGPEGPDDVVPFLGNVTHPSAAPDNHLLTVWSAGSLNSIARHKPAFDSGIYLIKSGQPIDEPVYGARLARQFRHRAQQECDVLARHQAPHPQ